MKIINKLILTHVFLSVAINGYSQTCPTPPACTQSASFTVPNLYGSSFDANEIGGTTKYCYTINYAGDYDYSWLV
jgi:hypothetical protein